MAFAGQIYGFFSNATSLKKKKTFKFLYYSYPVMCQKWCQSSFMDLALKLAYSVVSMVYPFLFCFNGAYFEVILKNKWI